MEKVEAIQEEGWAAESFHKELTRALTTVENARMEWNTCRLKFPILSGKGPATADENPGGRGAQSALAELGLLRACKLGLALTWPIALVGLGAVGLFAALLMQR